VSYICSNKESKVLVFLSPSSGPASAKADNELFVISSNPVPAEGNPPGRGRWRVRKPLKSEQHLGQPLNFESSDDDDVTSCGHRQTGKQTTNFSKKGVQGNDSGAQSPRKQMVAKKPKDLWAEVGRSGENGFHDDHYLRATKRTLPKLPKTLANRSATLFSAVEVAHPGASYNPSVDQHQTLLEEAAKQREQEMKKVKKVRRWMNGLSSLNQYEREGVWMKEISEGLFEDLPSASEDSGSERDTVVRRPIRAEDRKTSKQRRKEQMIKTQAKELEGRKRQRIRSADVFRLKTFNREIKQKESALLKKKDAKKIQKKEDVRRTHRLGRLRFVEPRVSVKREVDIRRPLRVLKSEGSILRDRYKSLQKRNIIEPRQRAGRKRKYKLKIVERRSSRMPMD
jgi:nucleolar protein 53